MKITKKQLHELAADCVLNFDFEKAALFFQILNIPWAGGKFPEVPEIREEVCRLLTGLINYVLKHPEKVTFNFSCKGLKVSFDMQTEFASKIMRLEFNALSSMSYLPLSEHELDGILHR